MDPEELEAALWDAAPLCPSFPHFPSRRSRLKQRQFFGEFPFDGGTDHRGTDHRDALGIPKSSLGVLNDKGTMAVPGSVNFLGEGSQNKPMGMENIPRRTSHSVFRAGYGSTSGGPKKAPENKTTKKGILLVPQPEETGNDPLNWPTWKRDCALVAVGLYCAVGGGMTPILAAGFTDVADEFHINVEEVSLTTGLYMLGMGLGSVVWSPTAILFGKRPVYLASVVMFILSNIWCAASHSFTSLLLARIFQGIAISPVECLPSATVAEIYFLHERAFRLGIYTLLLLGGKNLVPLFSAAIINKLGWHWVFWVIAIFSGVCGVLLFFLVPETFWDRAPIPKAVIRERKLTFNDNFYKKYLGQNDGRLASDLAVPPSRRQSKHDYTSHHPENEKVESNELAVHSESHIKTITDPEGVLSLPDKPYIPNLKYGPQHRRSSSAPPLQLPPKKREWEGPIPKEWSRDPPNWADRAKDANGAANGSSSPDSVASAPPTVPNRLAYTHQLRRRPTQSFVQQLKPYNGRLNPDEWLKVTIRPFILLSYPAVAFSSLIYACSVGWLIVISESVAMIYRGTYYDFDAMHAGYVYIGPFIGGVLGTAVAGKLSDVIVQWMARRNDGLYEPEFRLVMMLPVAITTGAGLIGFGWTAEARENWLIPTFFFSLVGFGCSLGSTTSITFVVDSYRQYAGEALVTLNFCKNVLHGLVFSLFVTHWLESDGARRVYMWIGIIQVLATLLSVPMYIYGKRMRMWTVRQNFMERF
ncbi:major facilitator superfamily domain-containing protein [Coniochaeta sp. 2T2.1]|nr:major facilitator superfamily domain-containing protein [Coniochaeta sp. 2T2.1]